MNKRLKITVRGFVQGVGFRPFVYKIATDLGLSGYVRNLTQGVVIELEGEAQMLESFFNRFRREIPPVADIHTMRIDEIKPREENSSFKIIGSLEESENIGLISPDIATCSKCIKELFDPSDRRFGYPFINCTNCGPRFTIIRELPYDRDKTTMDKFKMCPECQKEYDNPMDRRFHAQPNACEKCGPHYTLLNSRGNKLDGNPIDKTCQLIKEGEIVAVKGIGGFLLMADATRDDVVARLRKLKRRTNKPFALMVSDIDAARKIVRINPEAEKLLKSAIAPILLLPVTTSADKYISSLVAPKLDRVGIMLPYAPVHHLIMQKSEIPYLIATSGNRSDEPIAKSNDEALETLKGIVTHFLVHNREIYNRADDSVVKWSGVGPVVTRRARGYVPRPVAFPETDKVVLAVGQT